MYSLIKIISDLSTFFFELFDFALLLRFSLICFALHLRHLRLTMKAHFKHVTFACS